MTGDLYPLKAFFVFGIIASVITLLVASLLIAALRGTWHYWHRGTSLTHATIKVLVTLCLSLFASSFLFVRERRGLLVASFVLGPVSILLHMMWTWFSYQGPPQDFEQLPKPLEELDGVVTILGQGTAKVVFKENDIQDDIAEESDESAPDQPSTNYRFWAGVNGVVFLGISAAGAYIALHQPRSLVAGLLSAGALIAAVLFLRGAVTGRMSVPMKRWIFKP